MPSSKKTTEEPLNSTTGWVAKHVQDYVDSDGQKGHTWRGLPTLLLTTRGRKSGQLRRTALIYGQDGEDYVVVGSNGGSVGHPGWYLNLLENPQVELQVGAEKFTATAKTATATHKPRLWKMMAKIFPLYEKYQVKTKREIPVVVLKRA